ncbi:YciI family protein [Micromonospora cathayae]|uniref:YciI family protein n=1 Tax=Micromonospora cathayae TaxID=3028804 RepID=A0ABY7ZTN9_9ACTN|nr:YciI family protein [Micromonospora sp. HUAS 3]WDZ86248.1 YciI family protein [Micromonospora sp. HUAS 3]
MKYLMLIYGNEQIWNSLPADELTTLIGEVDAFNEALRASGELVESQGLVSHPRAVRMVGDTPVVTDGPYLEAKEYVGSYFLVDVASEERALEIARSYPALRFGTGRSGGGLEVWPLMTGTGGDH